MSIVSTELIKESESETLETNSTVITLSEEYLIITDGNEDADSVRNAGTVPDVGSRKASNLKLRCVSKQIDRAKANTSNKQFSAKLKWSTKRDSAGDVIENPLDRPARVSIAASEGNEPYFVDNSSTPKNVTNSAKETFNSQPERQTSEPTVQITVNVDSYNASDLTAVANTTNSTSFSVTDGYQTLTIGSGQGLMSAPKVSDLKEENDTSYYEITYTIKGRSDGWLDKILDTGMNEISGSDLVPIIDATGERVTSPVALDGSGSYAGVNVAAAVRIFQPYKSSNWSALPGL